MPSCPICFQETTNPHFCVPCRHVFCYDCISAWRRGTCPLCRENITTFKPIQLAHTSSNDSPNYAEKSKLFSLVLVIIFFLVDLQSSSGFLRCVVYPPCYDVCLVVWEILYILAMAIFIPLRCIYRLLVEIVIYELYDFFIAVLSMPINIVKILLSLPLYLFDGVKTFLLGNSWAVLLHRAIHISLIVLFLISASRTRILRQFEDIEGKLRAHFRHVIDKYKRRLKQS